MAGTVSLERATPAMQELVANLLELYSHDLSDVFSLDVGPDGRFGYRNLPLYWSSPDTHFPFVFRHDGHVAGFALVTRGSPMTDDPSDLDVAEFFVLQRYRRAGVGREAACALWNTMRGRWVVRVAEDNARAWRFWQAVVSRYTDGRHDAFTRSRSGRVWHVLTFDSRAAEMI